MAIALPGNSWGTVAKTGISWGGMRVSAEGEKGGEYEPNMQQNTSPGFSAWQLGDLYDARCNML